MEEQTQEVEQLESPDSFETSLAKEQVTEEAAPVTTETEAAPEVTPEPEVQGEVPAAIDLKAQELEDLKANGLLKALTAERKKRQGLEEQLSQYQQNLQSQSYVPETYEQAPPQVSTEAEQRLNNRLIAMSEMQVKSTHPDYDEKFNVFAAEATANPALYESVMSSDHPALAAYQAGKALLVHKKYGTDLDKVIDGVRKETEAELRKQIRAEIEQEFSGKVAARAKAPTNISAVGSSSPTDEGFTQSSWATALKRRR